MFLFYIFNCNYFLIDLKILERNNLTEGWSKVFALDNNKNKIYKTTALMMLIKNNKYQLKISSLTEEIIIISINK